MASLSHRGKKIPKTTNKTAGHTPFHRSGQVQRHLNYSGTGNGQPVRVVRKVMGGKVMSTSHLMGRNMGYYWMLPDGVLVFYSAKGSPLGPPGYLGQSIRCITEGMEDVHSEFNSIVENSQISAVLPVRDPSTGQAATFTYAQNTKIMQARVFVHVYEDVVDNTDENATAWCKNIIRTLDEVFQVRIQFGGNAADSGIPVPTSLNSYFLTEDVANLAMMGYEESIRDKNFFQDIDLVKKYFGFHSNVPGIFQNMYGIDITE